MKHTQAQSCQQAQASLNASHTEEIVVSLFYTPKPEAARGHPAKLSVPTIGVQG